MMKFAVVGTHGTGKTTLVEDMLAEWRQFRTMPMTYRDYAVSAGMDLQKPALVGQLELLEWMCERWREMAEWVWTVCDRSPLDVFLYTLGLGGEGLRRLREGTLECMGGWTLLWVRPEEGVELVGDGTRNVSRYCQADIDARFEAFFERHGGELYHRQIDVVKVKGTREERLMTVARLIGRRVVEG